MNFVITLVAISFAANLAIVGLLRGYAQKNESQNVSATEENKYQYNYSLGTIKGVEFIPSSERVVVEKYSCGRAICESKKKYIRRASHRIHIFEETTSENIYYNDYRESSKFKTAQNMPVCIEKVEVINSNGGLSKFISNIHLMPKGEGLNEQVDAGCFVQAGASLESPVIFENTTVEKETYVNL